MFWNLDNCVFFGGGRKKVSIPATATADPVPTPTEIDIEARLRAGDVRRRLRAQKGRRGTILTSGSLAPAEIGRKQLRVSAQNLNTVLGPPAQGLGGTF